MNTALRFLRYIILTLAAVVLVVAALFGYFVYVPAPELPHLSGTVGSGVLVMQGSERTYMTYMPRGLPKSAPLVVVLHGSGGNGAAVRAESGYGFDRLADLYRFAVVYPDAADGYWNACNVVGNAPEKGHAVDDVAFLSALIDKLSVETGVDRRRSFAVGSSRGGSMALRLALEAPSHFRAVAAVSAAVPTVDNFLCRPTGEATSVMIMNGTVDPLVPFDGGEISLLGVAYKNGNVLPMRASGQYFATLAGIAAAPVSHLQRITDRISVESLIWQNDKPIEINLVIVHGGGHGIPQPWRRRPRLLGPPSGEVNGPAMIWAFFERQTVE